MWCRRFRLRVAGQRVYACRAPHRIKPHEFFLSALSFCPSVECSNQPGMRSPMRHGWRFDRPVCAAFRRRCKPQTCSGVSVSALPIAAPSRYLVDASFQNLTIPISTALRGSVQRGLSAADTLRVEQAWGGRRINAIRWASYSAHPTLQTMELMSND